MNNILKLAVVALVLEIVVACKSSDADKKAQLDRPVMYQDRRAAAQQANDTKPSVGGENSHLDPQNSIYWEREYYLRNAR